MVALVLQGVSEKVTRLLQVTAAYDFCSSSWTIKNPNLFFKSLFASCCSWNDEKNLNLSSYKMSWICSPIKWAEFVLSIFYEMLQE
jgi:hypothetical protein